MNSPAFEKLKAGEEGCPSDLALDRLCGGELLPEAARKLEAHIETCAVCPERLSARMAGFSAFPEVDPRPLLAGIRRRLEEEAAAKQRSRWLRRFGLMLTPVLAAAAVLVVMVFVKNGGPATSSLELTREKGGLSLMVYRQSGQRSTQTMSGERFFAGDRLRFVIDLPKKSHINVLGVESSGGLYVAWPSSADVSTLREAGKGQELPGAVALDNSAGKETLYLVACPPAIGVPALSCQTRGAASPPSCANGCALTPFVLNKQ